MRAEPFAASALPPALEGVGSSPDAGDVARIAEHLRGQADALRARSASEVARSLGRAGARFLDDGDAMRRRALERLPEEAALSTGMARAVLDGMARDWTTERLLALLDAELPVRGCLDRVVEVAGRPDGVVEVAGADRPEERERLPRSRSLMAVGPALCVQIISGSVPGVSVNALLRSLLVKAPTLLKPGRGDTLLPLLFAEALLEEDPELAEALAVLYWPGGSTELEEAAMREAEVAVVYGSDETVSALRALAPATTRVVGYHHRIGVGVVGREALTHPVAPGAGRDAREARSVARGADSVALDVARSVALFEQRGCVCPQLLLVEEGGDVEPADFARLLAEAFDALEEELPSPPSALDQAGALRQLRETAEMQAASGRIEMYHGGEDAPWTLLFEREAGTGPGGSARWVRVRPIEDLGRLAEALGPLGPHLQSVGYAGLGDRLGSVAETLARVGASRLTPLRALSFPPPWWLHDGRGPLRELVRWLELERE